MIQTYEAVIDEKGNVQPLEDAQLPRGKRALVTVLDEKPHSVPGETAVLSEEALAEDWLRVEEEDAWSHLQSDQ